MFSDSEHRAVKVIVIRKSLPFVLQALSLLLALQQIVLDRVRRDAAMRWTRSSPACSASVQLGENGLSNPYGLTILASGWSMLIAASNLFASCKA